MADKIQPGSETIERKKPKGIALLALLLCLGLALTIAVLTSRLYDMSPDDSDVIALIPEDAETVTAEEAEKAGEDSAANASGMQTLGGSGKTDTDTERNGRNGSGRNGAGRALSVHRLNPDFEVSDDTQVWTTETEVHIFKYTYTNNQGIITVYTSEGDKVIAPGTENSYSFRLKNTGDVPLDYTVSVQAYVTPADIELPVEGRMKGYDGSWLVGSNGYWADVLYLDGITDSATLGVNQFANYTLDWRWPFESKSDVYDTWLGNEAMTRDITLTIVIDTVASTDADQSVVSASGSPKTGDESRIMLYILLGAGALLLLFLLLFFRKRGKEEEQETENQNIQTENRQKQNGQKKD